MQMSSSMSSADSADSEYYYSGGMSSSAITLVLLGAGLRLVLKLTSSVHCRLVYKLRVDSGLPVSVFRQDWQRQELHWQHHIGCASLLGSKLVLFSRAILAVLRDAPLVCERGPVHADRKVFEAKRSASSVTGESRAVEGLVQGRHITVVDTPGTECRSARLSPRKP